MNVYSCTRCICHSKTITNGFNQSRLQYHQPPNTSHPNKQTKRKLLTVGCWLKLNSMLSRLPCEPSSVSGVRHPSPALFLRSRFLKRLSVEEKTPLPALLRETPLSAELGRSRDFDRLRRPSAVSLSRLARLVRLEPVAVGESWMPAVSAARLPFGRSCFARVGKNEF